MRETLCVLGIVVLFAAVAAAGVLPALEIVRAGESLMIGGAWFGIPLQIVYFGLLGVSLRVGPHPVPTGWFWRPFAHHHLLTRGQRPAVLPFFYTGALAFVGIVIGMAIVVLGIIAGLGAGQ